MALNPQMVKLKLALESVGQQVGSSQDDIISTATGWILAQDRHDGDAHSSGPQFDAPEKPTVFSGDQPAGLYVGFTPVPKTNKRTKKTP
jgi:hypothetical protein